MGNYGRYDAHVAETDPFGTNRLIAERMRQRGYNQGIYDQQHAGPSVTEQNEARRQALYDQDIKDKLATDDWQTQNHYTDYEKQLDNRGLLSTDIDYMEPVDYGDAPGAHPKTFQGRHLKVRGKPDAAGVALMRELAAQGQLSGSVNYDPSTMAALNALAVERKAEAEKAQARADTQTSLDKELSAKAELAKVPVQLQAAQFAHDKDMLGARIAANANDPDAITRRRVDEIRAQAAEESLKGDQLDRTRRQAEYLTPQQESARSQAQALALRAQGGDPEAYHALRMLTTDPKLGINADVYRPSADRVLAQPQIAAELAAFAKSVEDAGYNPGADDVARAKAHAQRAIAMAADFGDDAKAEVARLVAEHVQKAGTGGTVGTALIPIIGPILAARRYANRDNAAKAFADLGDSL